jgi:hypothetical protein
MVRSIDPRRETLRAIQWQSSKPPYCLELMSRNPSWQRSCATASTDRTYDRKRSDPRAAPPLAGRGPSTYGLPVCQQGTCEAIPQSLRCANARTWPHPAGRTGAGHRAHWESADLPTEQDAGAGISAAANGCPYRARVARVSCPRRTLASSPEPISRRPVSLRRDPSRAPAR